MTYDVRFRAVADKLLTQFGGDVAVLKPTASTGPAYDPTPGPPDEIDAVAVKVKASERDDFAIDRSLYEHVYIVRADVEVADGDTIVDDGKEYAVKMVEPMQPLPGGEVLIYRVYVKSA